MSALELVLVLDHSAFASALPAPLDSVEDAGRWLLSLPDRAAHGVAVAGRWLWSGFSYWLDGRVDKTTRLAGLSLEQWLRLAKLVLYLAGFTVLLDLVSPETLRRIRDGSRSKLRASLDRARADLSEALTALNPEGRRAVSRRRRERGLWRWWAFRVAEAALLAAVAAVLVVIGVDWTAALEPTDGARELREEFEEPVQVINPDGSISGAAPGQYGPPIGFLIIMAVVFYAGSGSLLATTALLWLVRGLVAAPLYAVAGLAVAVLHNGADTRPARWWAFGVFAVCALIDLVAT